MTVTNIDLPVTDTSFDDYVVDENFYKDTAVIEALHLSYDYIDANHIFLHTQLFSLEQIKKYSVEFSRDLQAWEDLEATQWLVPDSNILYFSFGKDIRENGIYYFRIKNLETGETFGVTSFEVVFTNIEEYHKQLEEEKEKEEQKSFWEKVLDIPNQIISGLLDALKSLFIPSDGYFNNWIADMNTYFGDRFGIVYYPFELLIDFLTRIGNIQDSGNYTIHVPELKLLDTTIIKSFDYDLNSLLENEIFKHIHTITMLVVDAILGLMLVVLAKNTFVDVFGGRYVDGLIDDTQEYSERVVIAKRQSDRSNRIGFRPDQSQVRRR